MGESDPVINMGAFRLMCTKMWIDSKRYGRCHLVPISTQEYLIKEVLEGLGRGVHKFVCLKCRQSGTTTIVLAFLLYWMQRHSGMSGLMAINDNDLKSAKNLDFRKMYKGLAEAGAEWSVPLLSERREMVAFANGSSLAFDNANKREGTLGTSFGLNMMFGDEVGLWNDPEALLTLMPSLDGYHPARLYIWAGTARGFNLFHELCSGSEKASDAKFIFIGWWRHEWYRLERDDELGRFEKYWDGELLPSEEVWVGEVRSKYGVSIEPEQIAWWRWKLAEEFLGNEAALMQEYPPLPELAFQYGGNVLFDPDVLRAVTIEIGSASNSYTLGARYFRFKYGKNLLETRIERCEGRSGIYHLAVWEPPRDGEGVYYSLGVDPAYGLNETSDYSCIQLLRCYEDGMEQVAQFAARGLSTMQLAWSILLLFGAYHRVDGTPNVVWNIELQGGGGAVIQIIEQLQADVVGFYDRLGAQFDSLRAYCYKRVDSMTSNYTAKHSAMSASVRDSMLHHIKAYFENGMLAVRSLDLVREMSNVIRDADKAIAFSGKHNDLVMALGLAVTNYLDPIRYDLEGSGCTFAKWQKERELLLGGSTSNDMLMLRVSEWIKEKRDLAREKEEELRELLEGRER